MKRLCAFTIFFLFAFIVQAQESQFYYQYKQKKYLKEDLDLVTINTKDSKRIEEFRTIISNQPNIEKESVKLFGDNTLLIKVLGGKQNFNKNLNDIGKINAVFRTLDESIDLFWSDEICLQLNNWVSRNEILKIMDDYKLEIVSESQVAPFFILRLINDEDLLSIANHIAELEVVLYCHPNFFSTSLKPQFIPVDEYFNKQFYLKNTGQGTRWGTSTAGADIKMETAWEFTKGSSSITIAILDDGLDLYHQDFDASKIVQGYDYADGDADVYPVGTNAHGTCCAGIIAAKHNTLGVTGIAPGCKIRMLKIFKNTGEGTSEGNIASAIDNAWINGADVISNSWSYRSPDPNLMPSIKEAILRAYNNGRNGKGCVVVFAAGNTANRFINNNGEIWFPATTQEVITVGASNRNDVVANYSPNCMVPNNIYLDICAPSHHAYSSQISGEGFEVWSTDISGYAGYNPGTSDPNLGDHAGKFTSEFGGTSAACPQVSAAAALILSINPNLTSQQVANILITSADKVGGYNYNSMTSYPGLSVELGYGRLNVTSALQQLNPPLSYQFINEIGTTNDYGALVLDENKNDLITSGDFRSLFSGSNHIVRSNELPFIPNWDGSSITKKHFFWNLETSHYLLNYPFNADVYNTRVLKASFSSTAGNISLKNNLEYSNITHPTGVIELKDTWNYYKDENDNWFQSDDFIQYPSPFNIQNTVDSYGGVFLSQSGPPLWAPPYYSVKVDPYQDIPVSQTGRTHRFFFHKWTGANASFQYPNSTETGVVFTNENSIVQANLKGTQLSDDEFSYSSNSQNKFVRTENGNLHNVYVSMGALWYERSTNGGATWEIANYGRALNTDNPKGVSIDYLPPSSGDDIITIAYQCTTSTGSKVVVDVFKNGQPRTPVYYRYTVIDFSHSQNEYDEMNAEPVVSVSSGWDVMVVYKVPALLPLEGNPVTTSALYYSLGWLNGLVGWELTWYSPNNKWVIIPTTNYNSIHPAIAEDVYSTSNPTNYFHIAYQENNQIKYYYKFGQVRTGSLSQNSNPICISCNNGFSQNYSPSIISAGQTARVCWVGYRLVTQEGEYEVDAVPQYKVLFKDPFNTSRYWQFGNDVSAPSFNKSPNFYAFGWREASNQNKFADNTLSTVRILNTSGNDLQISNGTDKTNMYAMTFNHNDGLPYYFLMSNNLGSFYSLAKTTASSFSSGREGIVAVDNAEFYFALGDIKIDGQTVDFEEISDTVSISDIVSLNQNLISKPMNITDNSSFVYSVQYGINDSLSVAQSLVDQRAVNFKVMLVDNTTGETIGIYDDVTYNSSNLYQYNSISYQVNTTGIGNRTIRLKLVLNNNFDANYSLSKIYSNESVLAKVNHKQIEFDGGGLVKEYALAQNYPNPFNPSTTIRYQIPQDGIVTLKIYDVLGAEVATLVNEQKVAGKYEVNFNASALASGVYIYKIQAGSFNSSKKMILIK